MDRKQLANEYGMKVSRLAHRMILDDALADEAAQEAWYQILTNLDSFAGLSNIGTWIYTVARRTILRYAKSELVLSARMVDMHFRRGEIEYTGTNDERVQWVREKCDYCLTAYCHCLTNEARLIFLFRDIAELSYSQISEIMEMSQDNIRKIASRSREKVSRFMKKDCILMNPSSNCRCRIRKHIKAVELDKEYARLGNAAHRILTFRRIDKTLPGKNYWVKMLKKDVTNGPCTPLKG